MSDLQSISNSAVENGLFAASLAAWMFILWQTWRRGAPLASVPSEPVSWPALPVCATFIAALVVPQFIIGLRGPLARYSLGTVQWHALAMAVQGLVVVGLLRIAGPLRSGDFGWHAGNWRGDLAIGVGSFLASLIPVSYVNGAVEELGLRGAGDKHLFLKTLEADSGGTIVFW